MHLFIENRTYEVPQNISVNETMQFDSNCTKLSAYTAHFNFDISVILNTIKVQNLKKQRCAFSVKSCKMIKSQAID